MSQRAMDGGVTMQEYTTQPVSHTPQKPVVMFLRDHLEINNAHLERPLPASN